MPVPVLDNLPGIRYSTGNKKKIATNWPIINAHTAKNFHIIH